MKNEILSLLPGNHPWQNQIYRFPVLDSTSTYVKHLAKEGAPHGTVVMADSQTGGRGRLGRGFHSPAGSGLYLSVLLRPRCPAEQLMHLTCAAAVAMCDAIQAAAGFRPGVKWINDLVREGRKLGGILTELSIDPADGLVDYAVVGIGINIHQQLRDFPAQLQHMAGSLAMFCDEPPSLECLAAAAVTALENMDTALFTGKEQMLAQYRQDCTTLNTDVSLLRGDEVRYGRALTVDEWGALVVRFADGHTEAVNSGEVSVRGMYGYV